jgi:signal transduction histidine kinase
METQSAFMAAAAAVVLVTAILVRRRDGTSLLLSALTLVFGLWALARGATGIDHPGGPEGERVALGLLGPLALAFAHSLGARVPSPRRILPTVTLCGLLVSTLPFAPGSWAPLAKFVPECWSVGLVAIAAFLLARRRVSSTEDSPELTRIRYVARSLVLVVVAVGVDVGLGLIEAPRGATYFASLFYLYISYLHLSRVRVVDLRQLLGNTLALGLLATGVASFFAALHLWVGGSLNLFLLNAFLASFVLLLFYEPLKQGVQNAMDRWLVGGKVALERSVAVLSPRLTQALTLDQLLREFLRTLEGTERVTSSSIFLRDDPRMGFQAAASIGLSPRARVNLIQDPLFVRTLQTEPVLLAEDLERVEPGERSVASPEDRARLLQILRELDAQLIIALRAGTELVGFWTLTDANSAEPFSTGEVRLLRDLAERAAVSIENSKTFERIRVRDRLVTLGEMSAGLAHEIRNPIATIRAALALLEDPGAEDPAEIRRMVVEEVRRLDRVVGLFLDWARPSPSHQTRQDLGKVLERALADSGLSSDKTPVHLELEVEPELPPLPLDAEQLERIVSNLARNASQASLPGSTVRVTAQIDRTPDEGLRGLQIVIEDEGCGMDEETLARAFVPFFTTRDAGVGLGLALCERLVRAQGGQIDLRSEPGRGTRVRVWIPVPAASNEEAEEAPER